MDRFKKAFRRLPDPRAPNARHDLLEVLVIAFAAVLAGAEGPSDMAAFGRAKEALLRHFLRLEHGIPSHDTFGRLFQLLDPRAFEAAFRRFMAAFAEANGISLKGVVALDGKALRGAFARGGKSTPLQVVNVWAVGARLCLAQRLAPGRNEAVGGLEVLSLLDLTGCIVTTDALHCHRALATTARERGGDYVLALKENQSKLFAAAVRRFARGGMRSVAERHEPSTHDRSEWRRATVVRDPRFAIAQDFPGVVALGRITSRRRPHGRRAEPPLVRYFLLSQYLSATRLLRIVRSHWGIENQLHWVLDVVFNEDRSRTRKDHAPENVAILRKLALNVVRSHPAPTSLRQKLKRAGWDDAFLLELLSHMR